MGCRGCRRPRLATSRTTARATGRQGGGRHGCGGSGGVPQNAPQCPTFNVHTMTQRGPGASGDAGGPAARSFPLLGAVRPQNTAIMRTHNHDGLQAKRSINPLCSIKRFPPHPPLMGRPRHPRIGLVLRPGNLWWRGNTWQGALIGCMAWACAMLVQVSWGVQPPCNPRANVGG
jgi:hypothetical protein